MMPSSTDAVSVLMPVPPSHSRTRGTSTTNPKKPYTTEGMPASRLIAGFRNRYSRLLQKRARYMAVKIPAGTPTMSAPAVTYRLPTIIGQIPYRPLEGFQRWPPTKLKKPISAMAGTPFANRNTQMRITAAIDAQAVSANTQRITRSFIQPDPPSW